MLEFLKWFSYFVSLSSNSSVTSQKIASPFISFFTIYFLIPMLIYVHLSLSLFILFKNVLDHTELQSYKVIYDKF